MKTPIKDWGIWKTLGKVVRPVGNTLAGENAVGKGIHGFLDNTPIPNQAIAKLFKALVTGDRNQARIELRKVVEFRNVVAAIFSALILSGVITLEDLAKGIEVANKVWEIINQFSGF